MEKDATFTPKYDLHLEQSLLGCWMSEPTGKLYILAQLDSNDFYFDEHVVIANAIEQMVKEGEKLDYLTVASKLKSEGKLDRVGGESYLKSLVEMVPVTTNVECYRDDLADMAHIRKMGLAAHDAFEMSVSPGANSRAIEKVLVDGLAYHESENTVSAFQVAIELLQDMERGKAPPVPHSGLFGLDGLLWGFQPSQMYTIAARMSVGKTSLLSWIAMSAAFAKFPVLYISMEMSRKMVGLRMVSAIGKVDLLKYINHEFDDDELVRSVNAKQKLSELPIYFASNKRRTVDDAILMMRREKILHHISVVAIDYLQLLHDGSHESRVNELDAISGKLKAAAIELDVALICAVTANRGSLAEKRGVGIGDIRGSDSIAYDADVALTMDTNLERISPSGNVLPQGVDKIDLKVVKNRNGKTGDLVVYFDKRYQRWSDNAPEV